MKKTGTKYRDYEIYEETSTGDWEKVLETTAASLYLAVKKYALNKMPNNQKLEIIDYEITEQKKKFCKVSLIYKYVKRKIQVKPKKNINNINNNYLVNSMNPLSSATSTTAITSYSFDSFTYSIATPDIYESFLLVIEK